MHRVQLIIATIQKARAMTGLSQSEFGRLLETQISSVQRYEYGTRKVPDDYFNKCKSILKTPRSELRYFIQAFRARSVAFTPNLSLKLGA